MTLDGGSVTTTGGGIGAYATGAGSTITAKDVAVSTSGGSEANAYWADQGASIVVSGGTAQTSGQDAYVVASSGGASVQLTGTQLTATGLGSGGVVANGAGSSITGSSVKISVSGGYDTVSGFHPTGVDNQGFGSEPSGGTVQLTDTTILVTSPQYATGVYSADDGLTTLTRGSVSVTGEDLYGVISNTGATTKLDGTKVSASGDGSRGLRRKVPGQTSRQRTSA